MSSSLLLQQFPPGLVGLTWIIFVVDDSSRTTAVLWSGVSRT